MRVSKSERYGYESLMIRCLYRPVSPSSLSEYCSAYGYDTSLLDAASQPSHLHVGVVSLPSVAQWLFSGHGEISAACGLSIHLLHPVAWNKREGYYDMTSTRCNAMKVAMVLPRADRSEAFMKRRDGSGCCGAGTVPGLGYLVAVPKICTSMSWLIYLGLASRLQGRIILPHLPLYQWLSPMV